MRRRLLGRSMLLGLAAAVTLGAPAAHAADEITIDHVDSQDGTVSVLVAVDGVPAGAAVDPETVAVTVDGESVEATATAVEAGAIERTTILVLDASNSMKGDRIAAAQGAAKAFLEAAPPDVQIGLVTFAGEVKETVAPTTNHDLIAAAVDDIELSRETGVYDAIVQGVNLAGTEGARSVLLLSDGADTGSKADLDEVIGAAEESRVIVDVVSLDQSPAHAAALEQVSDASGGKVIGADSKALSDVFKAQANALASQLLVRFPAPANATSEASLEVNLDAGGVTYTDSAFVSLETTDSGPQAVDPGEPLVGKTAMLVGALALGLGLAGLIGIVLVSDRGGSRSQRRLNAYFGSGDSGGATPNAGAQSNFKDQAVALSEKVVTGDFETKISQRLNGAGSPMTAAEWILLHAGIAIGSAFVGFLLGGIGLAVLGLMLGGVMPWLYLKFKHARRLAKFNAQMPETLGLMAGGLQAGLSLPQAVDTVIREGHQPIAGELRRALLEQRLGVDITEALDGVAARMESEDFAWVVMAIRIQREVGGNLAEILNTVAETLREREYLRRQVKALSAEGRISAYILIALPPGIFAYVMMANPDYIRPLYTTFLGYMILGAAVVMLSIGAFAMSRLAKVEI